MSVAVIKKRVAGMLGVTVKLNMDPPLMLVSDEG